VLYQVIEAWAQAYMPSKMDSVHKLKLFAGIGTVSDVMPLLFENRQLVRDSLSLARLIYTAPPADPEEEIDINSSTLMTLLRAGGHNPVFVAAFEGFAMPCGNSQGGKLRSVADLNEGFYGFYLAPAFNAARRINGSMSDCFGVFVSDTPEKKAACMQRVIEGNELRKELTVTHLEAIENSDQPLAHVYFSRAGGHVGFTAPAMHKTDRQCAPRHRIPGVTAVSTFAVLVPDHRDHDRAGFSPRSATRMPVRMSDYDEVLAPRSATQRTTSRAPLLAMASCRPRPGSAFAPTPECDADRATSSNCNHDRAGRAADASHVHLPEFELEPTRCAIATPT
jgi:single-stranded-DNA-specific exonuclease